MPDARADDEKGRIFGAAEIKLENAISTDRDAVINDLVLEIDADLILVLTDRLTISTDIVLEQIEGADTDGFYIAHGEGIGFDSLLVNLDTDFGSVFAGRFEPNVYDDAFEFLPELWLTDLLEDDLEITGAIGVGAYVDISTGTLGVHRLEGSLFTADRSILGQTLITDRGRIEQGDGGVGNSGSLESFAVAIHGGDIPALEGISYHLGLIGQQADLIRDESGAVVSDTADEYRVRMTLQKDIELPRGLAMSGAVDFAHYWNAAGFDGASRDYLSGILLLENGPWEFGIAATGLWVRNEDGENRDEYNVKAGFSHELPADMTFDASISVFERQGKLETETLISFTKTIGFGFF